MSTQTLLSFSTALFLGLMAFVFTGTEAAPVKIQAAPMKSVAPAARINIVQAVLKPTRTKGKLTLKVTLHNPTATRASAFGVQAMYQRREVGKTNLRGLNPRTRITRSLLLRLPQQKGRPCVTVRLTKPRGSKLKLGTPRKACLKSSMVIRRGIDTSPGRKVGTRGKLGKTSRIGIKSKLGTKTIKGKKRLGAKYITVNNTLTINGQNTMATVYYGETATVSWAFPSGLAGNPNQVNIRVYRNNFPPGQNECQTGGVGAWSSGPQPGLSGSVTIPLTQSPFQTGQTYKVKACLINGGTGNTGDESNVVALQYGPGPDLVPGGFSLSAVGIRFQTYNAGPGRKQANSFPIKYHMTVYDRRNDGTLKLVATQTAKAYYATREQLLPGQWSTAEITGGVPYGGFNWVISLCINQDATGRRLVREHSYSSYSNNCKTWTKGSSSSGEVKRLIIPRLPKYVGESFQLHVEGILNCQKFSIDLNGGTSTHGPVDFGTQQHYATTIVSKRAGTRKIRATGTQGCGGTAEINFTIAPAVINGVGPRSRDIVLGQAVRIRPTGLGEWCDKLIVDWGDGTISPPVGTRLNAHTSSPPITHVYNSLGAKTIRLSTPPNLLPWGRDRRNCRGSARTTVNVIPYVQK